MPPDAHLAKQRRLINVLWGDTALLHRMMGVADYDDLYLSDETRWEPFDPSELRQRILTFL